MKIIYKNGMTSVQFMEETWLKIIRHINRNNRFSGENDAPEEVANIRPEMTVSGKNSIDKHTLDDVQSEVQGSLQ